MITAASLQVIDHRRFTNDLPEILAPLAPYQAEILLGEHHPEPRARVHPVRLKLSSRQADDRLLCLQFAIIIAAGNLRPCRGQSYVRVFGLLLPDRT